MTSTTRPNIVFILSDQQRRDSLGCYGHAIAQTPCLDGLAANGVTFDNAFTANVICQPSRAALLTGRYPRVNGVVTNGVALDANNEITLPDVLVSHGYQTACAGKLHLAPHNDSDPTYGKNESGYESPESPGFWNSGKSLPLPYYGFQEARICSGHAGDWMHYYRDLVSRDPGLPDLLKEENALKPPSGAPSSWKSAIPEEHHVSTWVADQAIDYIESFAVKPDPFFLFVGFPDPHFPYCPPAPWCDMFEPASAPMPRRSPDEMKSPSPRYKEVIDRFSSWLPYHLMDMPDEHVREIIAHTYGMVSLLDKNVGRITATLDRLAISDNTILVFTTDHGEHLGDHWLVYKASPFDELIHLPMIWHCPGRFATGTRTEGIVSHVDLMPTILDMAGIELPRGVQGNSYRTALEGGEFTGRTCAYLEDDALGPDGNTFQRTVRTHDFRLSFYLPENEGALYDLRNDPHEFVNRWHDPNYRDARDHLTELMLKEAMQAADPAPQRVAAC
jgi:arylsulfatase